MRLDRAGIQPRTHTQSRKLDEPSRTQQDGNLYPPVVTATPIKTLEGKRRWGEHGESGWGGMQNRGAGGSCPSRLTVPKILDEVLLTGTRLAGGQLPHQSG